MGEDLNEEIVRAHATGDLNAMARLYARAGQCRENAGDTDAACFLYTAAYVFALDVGDETIAARARKQLMSYGREA